MAKKYIEVASIIKQRILNGDYALSALPSERRLAADSAVSYATARRAVQHLIEENVVFRKDNGRLAINNDFVKSKTKLTVAFIKGNWALPTAPWQNDLQKAADAIGATLKIITFAHKNDPVISEAIDGDFDLVVFAPFPHSKAVCRKMGKNSNKILSLFMDYDENNIAILKGSVKQEVKIIVDHLKQSGHTQIAFWEQAPADSVIKERKQHYCSLVDSPECLSSNSSDSGDHATTAREQVKELIRNNEIKSSAIICSTMTIAFGVARGIHESDLSVGKDIAIAALGNADFGKNYIPSISGTTLPNLAPLFTKILNEVKKGDYGKNLSYDAGPAIFIKGEST